MKIAVYKEIVFKTARSGGKGGQNVNKVETMVEGYFNIEASALLTREQKDMLLQKLANKINADGLLQVRSQVYRSQLDNKQEVIKKMEALIEKALQPKIKRVPTKPSKAAKEKRIESKKRTANVKENRKKIRFQE